MLLRRSLRIKMDACEDPCAFEILFTRNVPHILEKIFFSLDYRSFQSCFRVNSAWNELLSSQPYQKMSAKKLSEKDKNYKCYTSIMSPARVQCRREGSLTAWRGWAAAASSAVGVEADRWPRLACAGQPTDWGCGSIVGGGDYQIID